MLERNDDGAASDECSVKTVDTYKGLLNKRYHFVQLRGSCLLNTSTDHGSAASPFAKQETDC